MKEESVMQKTTILLGSLLILMAHYGDAFRIAGRSLFAAHRQGSVSTTATTPFVVKGQYQTNRYQRDFLRPVIISQTRLSSLNGQKVEEDDDNDFFVRLPDEQEVPLSEEDLRGLTIPQLKQQLRLRGLLVSGRKEELIQRLIRASGGTIGEDFREEEDDESNHTHEDSTTQVAQADTGDFVDVTEFLDPQDKGKATKSISSKHEQADEKDDDGDEASTAEVWGAEAKIVDDYEGRKIVVDSMVQSVVEFTGSNQTSVQAYCVASRDALKPFLAGGRNASSASAASAATESEALKRLREIQSKREEASKRPVHFEDQSGLDEGDETGIFKDILHRDFSDWGKYTQTGAQLSASEVQGVILLSDVYGPFTDDTKTLADKIAFECQPLVVFAPDLFRGDPWVGPTDAVDAQGRTYEQWRSQHSDQRVSVDIRAATACLRERYGVSSVVVWGTCYGGGRALEIASGWLPENGNIHDVDGNIGPPSVDPMAVIAWYPTRYNATELFGHHHMGTKEDVQGQKRQLAVMAVFAGEDDIPGATVADANVLKDLLQEDDRVIDHMVKVFPGQQHGFAHHGISRDDEEADPYESFIDEEFGGSGKVSVGRGDAEVACLLSTAFMETYSRVFLPTVGPPISLDDKEEEWSRTLEMKDLVDVDSRDIRREIENATNNFVEEPLGGYRIDPTDESQEEELKKLLRSMQDPNEDNGQFAITDDDDLATMYAKLTASDDNFQLF